MERVALVHDAGKLTPWFRQHLNDESPAGPKHHAPISALLAHYVLEVCGFEGEDPLIGFVAVARHHGSLPDVGTYTHESTVGRKTGRLQQLYHDDVPEQLDIIEKTVPDLAEATITKATDGKGSWSAFAETLDGAHGYWSITDHVSRAPPYAIASRDPVSDEFYASVLQVWSALVFADKTSAASLTTGVPIDADAYRATRPRLTAVEAYVRNLQREAGRADLDDRARDLNDRREEARQSVRERTTAFLESGRSIATLTLPTGLGKTLTGLDAVLTILDARESEDGRVVYALPFTSIIDQVAAEARNIFDADDTEDLLTIDHHLAKTLIELDGESIAEEVPDDKLAHVAEMLGESWRSGLVVTTFVQLFESLTGPKNSRSMKLPALYDSVVILDEPQALPLRWWKLVRRLVGILTDEYAATVIAMTATQPHLLKGADGGEPFELVEDYRQYYDGLDRVWLDLDRSAETYLEGVSDPLSYGEAANKLADALAESNSVLAICNTIDSARELTESLSDAIDAVTVNEVYGELLDHCETVTEEIEADDIISTVLDERANGQPLVVHLSTRHRPCDRRNLIEVSSTLAEQGYPIALVSTQLVEAGVDISFDRVFRDFAPMDSIVQAAGRCNRSFDRDNGRVTVWLLEPPEGRETTPASAVYARDNDSLTKLTAHALDGVWNGEPLSERIVTLDAVSDYFDRLDGRNVGNPEYVEYVNKAEGGELGRLSLIDKRPAADVVVARTREECKRVWEISNAYEAANWDRLDELFDKTKEWSVSVPLYSGRSKTAEKLIDCDPIHPGAELRKLDGRPDRHAGFFDSVDGVVIPDSTVEARLL